MAAGEGNWIGMVEDEEASLITAECVAPTQDKEEDDTYWAERERKMQASVRPKKHSNQGKKEYVKYRPNRKGPGMTPEYRQNRREYSRRRVPAEQKVEPAEDNQYLTPTPGPSKKPVKKFVISLGDDSSSSDEAEEGGQKKDEEEQKAKDKPMSKSEIMGNMRKKVILYAESLYTLVDPNEVINKPMEDLSLAYQDYGMVHVVAGRPG